jgi:hypothetical protein
MMSPRSVARVLADFRWWLLGAAGIIAFALGCVGFASAPQALDHPTWTDVAYWSLTLFTFTGPAQTHLPVTLDIARFLAPIVTACAGVSALASLFRDRLRQMRIPLMRGHVVVCGLGDVGNVFVRHLHEAGAQIVVIEQDPANPGIELCNGLRVPVIVGDAQLERTLHAAGLRHADRLLAVCSVDAVNTEIVAVARRLAADRPSRDLRCLARIGDPELCALLLIQEANLAGDSLSLDFFSTDEICARLLLDDFPIDTGAGRPHIAVAHLDALGARLVLHAARGWFEDRADAATPLWITVIDDHAEERVRSLLDQYPALEHVCRFICACASLRDIHGVAARHADTGAPPLTRGYITAHRDEQALETALVLRHHLDASVPLVVALSQRHEVARLINDVSTDRVLTNTDVFPTFERTCTMELIEGGPFETIARAIRRWLDEERADGEPAPSWSEPDESREESSRAQARSIVVKLASFGSAIAPLRDWGASEFKFTSQEIERLAIAEHERWMSERLQAGWRLGPGNTEQKMSPYLVPFDELPTDIAEGDRMFLRAIPDLLASVGLQVIRVHTPPRDRTRAEED